MTPQPSCASCRFATDQNPNDGSAGGPVALGAPKQLYCRRYPPTIVTVPTTSGLTIHHVIPVVTGRDWCGEYRSSLVSAGDRFVEDLQS